jgi:hypothetical protein
LAADPLIPHVSIERNVDEMLIFFLVGGQKGCIFNPAFWLKM